ncbi:SGNH/GDSL hydrolase family protein [Sphingomonas sp. ac-8]|uniref:SGNH/GDSL hydrolase family protein n=1 Tax=Sphingomonas sp. ac-8 TaxID=3242977 RepID=UPI003A80318D
MRHPRRVAGATALATLLVALGGCATLPRGGALALGARYVAMGSSFAAGPGIPASADTPPNRCTRSTDNYAHQLARRRGLTLVDVSCSGATTAHLLGPWNALAPQLDALTPDTALVTVTIGGNDVNYIGGLFAASEGTRITAPAEAAWARLAQDFDRISAEVRRRALNARLIYVDYVTLLPDGAPCAQTPLSAEDAAASNAIARRLAAATAEAAKRAGAGLVRTSALSRGHDACAAEPWATAYLDRDGMRTPVAYHPNKAAMTAVADALDASLPR